MVAATDVPGAANARNAAGSTGSTRSSVMAREVNSRAGSLSCSSTDSDSDGRGSCWTRGATSVVLPYPAGAEGNHRHATGGRQVTDGVGRGPHPGGPHGRGWPIFSDRKGRPLQPAVNGRPARYGGCTTRPCHPRDGVVLPSRGDPLDQPQAAATLGLWVIGEQAWQTRVQIAHRDMQQLPAQFQPQPHIRLGMDHRVGDQFVGQELRLFAQLPVGWAQSPGLQGFADKPSSGGRRGRGRGQPQLIAQVAGPGAGRVNGLLEGVVQREDVPDSRLPRTSATAGWAPHNSKLVAGQRLTG